VSVSHKPHHLIPQPPKPTTVTHPPTHPPNPLKAKAALLAGRCVVIGLQSTGEAAADAMGLEPGPVAGFVSTTRELLLRFLGTHFPVAKEVSAEGAVRGCLGGLSWGGGGRVGVTGWPVGLRVVKAKDVDHLVVG